MAQAARTHSIRDVPKKNASLPERLRVVVIHRDPEVRRALAERLETSDCEAFQAETRKDGLRLIYEVEPHLVFLHVVAEEEDDWETFSRIRLFTDVPSVILTDKEPEPAHRSFCGHNAAVLVQPFEIEEAVIRGRRLLKSRGNSNLQLHPGTGEKGEDISLKLIDRSQALAIDRALQDIGDTGEIRLIVHRGHLRFLEKIKTEDVARGFVRG